MLATLLTKRTSVTIIKNIARKLLGKERPKPFVIDSVAKTSTGLCIVGWYSTSEVTKVTLAAPNNITLESNITFIDRSDVIAVTKKPAIGFQLLCQTDLDIHELRFIAKCKDSRQFSVPLTLRGDIQPVETPTIDLSKVPSNGLKGTFEFALHVDEYVYVVGWLLDSGESKHFNLDLDDTHLIDYQLIRYTREDVVNAFPEQKVESFNAGYIIVFKLEHDKQLKDAKQLTLKFDYANQTEKQTTSLIYNGLSDPTTNLQRMLNAWQPHIPAYLTKADMFIPLLDKMYPRDVNPSIRRVDFGTAANKPKVSIIIPLYGRIDFMRYQLSNFERFIERDIVEVLYVLDDPKLCNETIELAREVAQIVTLPFSILALSQNVGFGNANNIGAKYSRSENLLLLNSDVLPKSPNWLEKLLETCIKSQVGIVGARLLFEDETIQHDGMAPMTVNEYPGLFFNDHPKKGWPVHLAPFKDAEEVCPLITAACWMIKKADFDKVGGFDPTYILGDFEDSDLCLKIEEQGKRNVIRKDVELYHLERQSQNLVRPGHWKHNLTVLNAIKYNNRWRDTLCKLKGTH